MVLLVVLETGRIATPVVSAPVRGRRLGEQGQGRRQEKKYSQLLVHDPLPVIAMNGRWQPGRSPCQEEPIPSCHAPEMKAAIPATRMAWLIVMQHS